MAEIHKPNGFSLARSKYLEQVTLPQGMTASEYVAAQNLQPGKATKLKAPAIAGVATGKTVVNTLTSAHK